LHQPVDAIVVRWETAPRISLAIAAAESRVWSLRDQIAHCYEEPVDSVGALHMHLASCLYVLSENFSFIIELNLFATLIQIKLRALL
jgi:hypothetical protein